MWKPVVAIAIGSTLGGLMRWGLSLRLNALFPDVPPGTLAANIVAGYIVGIALAFFAQAPGLSPEWRLLVITGFCGGFSTFSTFTNELMQLLKEGQWLLAGSYITISLLTGLVCLYGGFRLVQLPD